MVLDVDTEGLNSQIDAHGFAVVRQIVSSDVVASLRGEFDRVLAESRPTARTAGVRSALRRSEIFAALAGSTSIRSIIEPVVGADAFVARSILFDKRADANWDVTWHQDTAIAVRRRIEVDGYGPWSVKGGTPHVRPPAHVLEHMLTLRLHLDACDHTTGALLVVPGSHRQGIRVHTAEAEGHGERQLGALIEPAACDRKALTVSVESGDAVLMRPLILHASRKAHDPSPESRRRVIHLEFAAKGLDGGLEWARL